MFSQLAVTEDNLMLILERMPRERILVGDDIVITVLGCAPSGRTILGFDAPKSIKIDREELRINKEASSEGCISH